jgi:MOSC domain-containing protein YiiM
LLNPASPLAKLFAAPIRPGIVTWLGVRPGRRAPPVPVEAVALDPETGILGDHYRSRRNQARQVTLVSQEHLAAIAGYLGLAEVAPARLRRNIAVAGINLMALQDSNVRIGTALLQVTGPCHPCSRMEEEFGSGGYNAVRGHGGVTARVLVGGKVRIGDPVAREGT